MLHRAARLVAALLLVAATVSALHAAVADPAAARQVAVDEEVRPGNPVVGSDAPGDVEDEGPNYRVLALVAVGLIATGALLLRLERWERRRTA